MYSFSICKTPSLGTRRIVPGRDGGDSRFGLACDAVTLWCVTVPIGVAAAFIFHAPVMVVYFLLNLDEIIKLPAVFRRFYKYRWVRNLTAEGSL